MAEAEYQAVAVAIAIAIVAAQLKWISWILQDVGVPQLRPSLLFSDNISSSYLTTIPVVHALAKHIELNYHFIHKKVALSSLITRFIPPSL